MSPTLVGNESGGVVAQVGGSARELGSPNASQGQGQDFVAAVGFWCLSLRGSRRTVRRPGRCRPATADGLARRSLILIKCFSDATHSTPHTMQTQHTAVPNQPCQKHGLKEKQKGKEAATATAALTRKKQQQQQKGKEAAAAATPPRRQKFDAGMIFVGDSLSGGRMPQSVHFEMVHPMCFSFLGKLRLLHEAAGGQQLRSLGEKRVHVH